MQDFMKWAFGNGWFLFNSTETECYFITPTGIKVHVIQVGDKLVIHTD
jgi:hypothetical protein